MDIEIEDEPRESASDLVTEVRALLARPTLPGEMNARAVEVLPALCDELDRATADKKFLGKLLEAQANTMSKVVAERNQLRDALRTAQTTIKELHERVFPGGWIIYTSHSPEWKQIEAAAKGEQS